MSLFSFFQQLLHFSFVFNNKKKKRKRKGNAGEVTKKV